MASPDADMVVLGERLAQAIRRMLNGDGTVANYKLMGEVINALNAWEDAMEERFNHDVQHH
jgi:hypothetical protein